MLHQKQHLALSILILFTIAACGSSPSDDGGSAPAFKLFGDIGSEKSYCSTVTTHSPGTTITATAQYQYRTVSNSAGLTTAATQFVRYAEVQVLDSSGATVQCGETDSSGNINITVPRTAGTYTLKVLSRADNNYVKASVLNNPTAMEPYFISSTFTLDGSEPTKAVTLTPADYQNTLEGGAFNILDQIYAVNEYIRNNSTCSTLGNICTLFTVAPKVQVFWKPGLSPGAYYQQPTASISFFTDSNDPSYGMASGIYMMGGVNGDVCVDTDHFDNSVVIHEYGHFLEYALSDSDSPGGSHDGKTVIDPRLAWSEGWSNFLQGAVRGESRYVDTTGNVDCPGSTPTGVNVGLNLEKIVAGQDSVLEGTTYVGEGVFREVSVSRVLWDTMEIKTGGGMNGDGKGANVGFAYIWKVFSDPSIGFRSPNIYFRNVGHFNEIMRSIISANAPAQLTDFDDVVSNEAQRSDRREYAYVVTPKSSTCPLDLQGTPSVNNLAKTNDFFLYYYDGSVGNQVLTMRYSAASGTPSDLDMYVWKKDHTLGDMADVAGTSARFYPESGASGVETLSLAGQPAGYFLIHIQADPDGANAISQYQIETDSGAKYLCP